MTDFGIARAGTASQMTEAGSIIGTAQYLSPEQARGAPVDQRSDLYSLGIVLYEMLTGQVPFTGDTPVEIAMKHLSAGARAAVAQAPGHPARARPRSSLRALAKDPSDRYQTPTRWTPTSSGSRAGLAVSPQTGEAATAVLAGAAIATAATTIAPRRRRAAGDAPRHRRRGRYYEYDEPPRAAPLWPWLIALVLIVAAAGVGGWYALAGSPGRSSKRTKPVDVPTSSGSASGAAVSRSSDART